MTTRAAGSLSLVLFAVARCSAHSSVSAPGPASARTDPQPATGSCLPGEPPPESAHGTSVRGLTLELRLGSDCVHWCGRAPCGGPDPILAWVGISNFSANRVLLLADYLVVEDTRFPVDLVYAERDNTPCCGPTLELSSLGGLVVLEAGATAWRPIFASERSSAMLGRKGSGWYGFRVRLQPVRFDWVGLDGPEAASFGRLGRLWQAARQACIGTEGESEVTRLPVSCVASLFGVDDWWQTWTDDLLVSNEALIWVEAQ